MCICIYAYMGRYPGNSWHAQGTFTKNGNLEKTYYYFFKFNFFDCFFLNY